MALPTRARPTSYSRAIPTAAGPADLEPPDRLPAVQPPVRRARTPLVLVGASFLLTGVLVGALLVGGGGPPPTLAGLPDAGALTGWGSPVVDLAGRVLAVLTVGQLTYAALLAPTGPVAGTVNALRGTTWSAAGWLLAEVAALVLTTSSVYGVPVTDLSLQAVLALPTQLPAGRAAAWVVVLLAVVIVGSARVVGGTARDRGGVTRSGSAVLLLVALSAVVLPGVLAGHSAAAENHVPAVLALSVHVVTASLWVGGLVGLLLHGRDRAHVVPAVRRFSALALACVVMVLASGVVAVVLVAGRPSWSWTGAGWTWLLAAKSALLGSLAVVGWWHRRRTMPALAAGAPRAFVRLGVVEVALMTLTLALSVALAASPAPALDEADGSASGAPAPVVAEGSQGTARDGDAPEEDLGQVPPGDDAPAPTLQQPIEDMSGHDHGDLSVSILVDDDRFHVTGTVRPGRPVTVYNRGSSPATITAVDGSFDADIGPRTFITFVAPAEPGDYSFVSRPEGIDVDGFADSLLVRADP